MDLNISYQIAKEDLVGVLRTILLFLDSLNFDATSAVFRDECTNKGYDEVISAPAKILIVQSSENSQRSTKNETHKTQESQTPFSTVKANESFVFEGFVQYTTPSSRVQLSNDSLNAAGDVDDDKPEMVYCNNLKIETNDQRIKQYPNTAEQETECLNETCVRKIQSAPSIHITAAEIPENSIENNDDVEEKDKPVVSCTPIVNCTEMKRKFKQLQEDHHKLMSVTVELTTALQTYISGQFESFNSALTNCKTIYPDLFQPDNFSEVEKSESAEIVKRSGSDAQIEQPSPLEGKILSEILVDSNNKSSPRTEPSAKKSSVPQPLQVPKNVKSFTIVLTEPEPPTDVDEEINRRNAALPRAELKSSNDTRTDSVTSEPAKVDTNERVQMNFSYSPEASYSEETKQFYHVPSSKTGIFETQKIRKLHRVPPSFTRTTPMPTAVERPLYMCTANSFYPQVYSKLEPIIPKEGDSVNNPPYALNTPYKVCYRNNHNYPNKTKCHCKGKKEYNKYRCNCYNAIKGYLERSSEHYVAHDDIENNVEFGQTEDHCICRASEQDESNVKLNRSSKSPVTINKKDSDAGIANFCYNELRAALNVANFDNGPSNPEAEAAFRSRPKLLRTPPQMEF